MNKERLVFEVAEGVTIPWEGELMSLGFTPEGGREIVSRAGRHMSLNPSVGQRQTTGSAGVELGERMLTLTDDHF